jgi:hypothetical protein
VQPAGSWALELKQAGHTTFMKPPTGVETWLLDRVFGGGEARGGRLRVGVNLHRAEAQRCLLFAITTTTHTTAASSGRMSRDLAISQTAAAMLAWFQQQLVPPTSSSSSSSTVAAAASASHMPLAAAGLNAAAAALTLAPAPAEATTSSSESPAAPFGAQLLSSFKRWVTSPLVAGELEFSVKGAEGGAAAAAAE